MLKMVDVEYIKKRQQDGWSIRKITKPGQPDRVPAVFGAIGGFYARPWETVAPSVCGFSSPTSISTDSSPPARNWARP